MKQTHETDKPKVLNRDQARQGRPGFHVRNILVISLAAAALAMIVIYSMAA